MLNTKFKFSLPGDSTRWTLIVHERIKAQEQHFVLKRGKDTVFESRHDYDSMSLAGSRRVHVADHDLELEFGAVSLVKYGLVVRQGEEIIWRSTDKPFREAGKIDQTFEKIDAWSEQTAAPTPEAIAQAERQKALRPSIFVDIGFGILFFFVAREFGLVSAALTGAGATLLLTAINPFVKWDLLGGFAAFGAVMALISAGIAWAFEDDLIIKLRGTIMAMIGASFALYDAFVLKGGYLGKRMAMYMEGLGDIAPKRASIALACATLLIMAIDTPLAFILTTDQWIWYNSFLDTFIAIPIVLGAMYMARTPEKDH
ncbi:MAG: hypothetical protein AAFP97_01270 [Pseudomonadota bacterium]